MCGGAFCWWALADESQQAYEREVREFFRPEFFNRLDGVVTFAPLGRDTCARVVRKELNDLVQREGLVKRRLKLRFTDALVEHLVAAGFDARYGARPLQRAIEQRVVARLSRFLIERPDTKGGRLEIDFAGPFCDVVVRHAGTSTGLARHGSEGR